MFGLLLMKNAVVRSGTMSRSLLCPKKQEHFTQISVLVFMSDTYWTLHSEIERMDHNETGCQAADRPILCVNNCGFFGSAATQNMCSKCHKEAVLKEDCEKLAASSIENLVNGTSNKAKKPVVVASIDVKSGTVEPKVLNMSISGDSSTGEPSEGKKGPSRCTTCRKRVGLTGFSCRCGNLFCASHRYSDKHECPFDYRAAGQNAIAKANPVVKAEKLEKI